MRDELILVKRILSGDIKAWHRFVEEHIGAIEKIIGRYINDGEIVRDLTVSLLEKLKTEKLARFNGRSTLGTWLFVVTVNFCRDYFRSVKGVRHILTALDGLLPIDRRYFKLAFVQALPLHEVLESIRTELGGHITYLDLIECEERIVRQAHDKKLGRLIEKLLSPPVRQHALSARDALSAEKDARRYGQIRPLPDILMESELFVRALKNLREALQLLPYKDQIILQLRFEHKASARQICESLDLGNEKVVYRRLEKLFARLKSTLLDTGVPLEIYEGIVQNLAELRSWEDRWNIPPDDRTRTFH